ncbi:ORF4 [Broome virga-like virus 1]|nr:ORF4 [Broome virga-like virus 1]
MNETIVVSQKPAIRKGFFQSCFDSYSVLVDSPFIFFLFIVAVFTLIAEINNSYGPLELFSNALVEYCKEDKTFKSLALLLLSLVTLIIKYKTSVLLSLLFIIPALLDSSMSTWLLSISFVFISFISSLDVYRLFLFSQFYYMYVFVDNHFYKALLLSLSFIVFLLGYNHFSSIIGVQ